MESAEFEDMNHAATDRVGNTYGPALPRMLLSGMHRVKWFPSAWRAAEAGPHPSAHPPPFLTEGDIENLFSLR